MTERLIAVANGRLVGTRLMRPSIVLIGGATICLACAGAADGPPRSGGAEWEFVEDLRLDANVEDFSQFRRFYVGPQHEIVVREPQDFRLRLYDSTGTLVAAFGRKGEGPGEFQHMGSSFWAADTLIVWDARLSRMTYLLLDGTLVRTEAVPLHAPNFNPFDPNFDAGGADSIFSFFNPEAIDDAGAMLGVAYLRVSTDGGWESLGTVILRVPRDGKPRAVASPPQHTDERWGITVSGITNRVPFAFQPQTRFAPDGSRFLFSTADQSTLGGGTYSLTMLRPNGDTIFARSYAYGGEPIPDSALDRAIAAMPPPENGRSRRFRALARQRAPAVYAPIIGVTLGLDGTVWVQLRSTDRGTPVHVVSETGDPIGFLLLPMQSWIQQASMTHVWVTETDLFDLPSVVRYRVIRRN